MKTILVQKGFDQIEDGLEEEILDYVQKKKLVSKGKASITELCDWYSIIYDDDSALNLKRE